MGTLPTPLKPFSNPHRPVNPETAPDQLRGNDNQLGKALNEHTQDDSLHTVSTSTSGVSSGGATTIYPAISGMAVAWIQGDSGGGATFVDQVAWNGATNVRGVISSTTVDGAPAARTYTVATGILKLQMASGTYSVVVIPIEFT